jgi:predicted RND superfamily exporter protein
MVKICNTLTAVLEDICKVGTKMSFSICTMMVVFSNLIISNFSFIIAFCIVIVVTIKFKLFWGLYPFLFLWTHRLFHVNLG